MTNDRAQHEDLPPLGRVVSKHVRWILLVIALLIIASSGIALVYLGTGGEGDSLSRPISDLSAPAWLHGHESQRSTGWEAL